MSDTNSTAPHLMPAADSTTGRFLVLLQPDDIKSAGSSLHERAGFRVATLAGLEGGASTGRVDEGHGIIFEDLGVAVVNDSDHHRDIPAPVSDPAKNAPA